MTLSTEKCASIEYPALSLELKSVGLASNFPSNVLYGTQDSLGLGAPGLYTTQGIKHIRALMDHGLDNNITGHQLQACIERHKMEIGT
eukprot:10039625-Ditylum_brightwellii.AAC.1